MTHDNASLIKLLREEWRGDTASDLMADAADRIDALVKERDELSAVVEKMRELHVKRGRPALPDCTCGPGLTVCATREALSTAPADALAEHDAALMDSLASEFERAGQYIGLSFAIIRLRERARLIREGDKK